MIKESHSAIVQLRMQSNINIRFFPSKLVKNDRYTKGHHKSDE